MADLLFKVTAKDPAKQPEADALAVALSRFYASRPDLLADVLLAAARAPVDALCDTAGGAALWPLSPHAALTPAGEKSVAQIQEVGRKSDLRYRHLMGGTWADEPMEREPLSDA